MKLRDGACGACLYGDHSLLDARGVADKTQEIARSDSYFVCHEATARGLNNVMCPGWLEAAGHTSNAGRMFQRIAAISPPQLWKPAGPPTDRDYAADINMAKRARKRA